MESSGRRNSLVRYKVTLGRHSAFNVLLKEVDVMYTVGYIIQRRLQISMANHIRHSGYENGYVGRRVELAVGRVG